MERRLAAILAADVVGYSRLTGADEEGTLAALKVLRESFVEPLIAEHRGRVVKLMGDGILAEFPSAVDAVRCAAAWQEGAASAQGAEPMEFRIGVNLGDVVVDGADVLGDGVNVAARLEALAEPGGIVISDMVQQNVSARVDIAFDDLGPQSLKNIDRQVRAWKWAPGTSRAPTPASAPAAETAAPLPERPSIVVLPFTNMSGDPEQEYFSDGITEDIITELSRFRSLHVIARHSAFAYKGAGTDIQEIAAKLGVRYAVEGSIRKASNRIRVNCQLVEGASGSHVWAERYDREFEDLFEIQDDLVHMIATTVGGRIEAADKSRAERLNDPSASAYDLCLRAQSYQDRNTREAYDQAEQWLRQAMAIDPHLAQACHQLSLVEFWRWYVDWAEDPEATLEEAFRLAQEAVALDASDGMVHAHLSMLHLFRREFDQAGHRIAQALRLNPNDVKVLGIHGEHLIAMGEPKRAIELFETLHGINPIEPAWITRLRAVAHFTSGDYVTAVSILESLPRLTNLSRAWLASALALAERIEDAGRTLETFLATAEREMANFPGRSLAAWRTAWRGIPYRDEEHLEAFLDGLRQAGLAD